MFSISCGGILVYEEWEWVVCCVFINHLSALFLHDLNWVLCCYREVGELGYIGI